MSAVQNSEEETFLPGEHPDLLKSKLILLLKSKLILLPTSEKPDFSLSIFSVCFTPSKTLQAL